MVADTAEPPARKRRSTPHAVRTAGYVTGLLTLAFLMVVTFAGSAFNCFQQQMSLVVLAFGAAMSFGFIGGSAKATGELKVIESVKPIAFGVTGGIAVLILVLVFGWALFLRGCTNVPVVSTPTSPMLNVPANQTFSEVARAAGFRFGFSVGFKACAEPALSAPVDPGEIRAGNNRQLLEKIRFRVTTVDLNYTVNEIAKDERYDIVCR